MNDPLTTKSAMRLPFHCSTLDTLFDGGIESGALTEMFGEAGAGKTNACLQLAVSAVRDGRKVVFIDTEGVSMDRLQQIAGDDFRKVQQSILFFEPLNAREQEQAVEKAARVAAQSSDVGLIIVDSATLHYRLGLGSGDDSVGRRILAQQIQSLVSVARKRDIPVVITNQVYTNIDKDDQLEPLGGTVMRHLSKAVVRFEKLGHGRRKATMVKHRSIAEGREAVFHIANDGLSGEFNRPAADPAQSPETSIHPRT